MSQDLQRPLELGEVLSFAATAAVMLSSTLFFPEYFWLFILLALVEGISTRFRTERVLSLNRIFFAFILILLGAEALGLDALGMILETVVVIAIMDLLFLLRRTRARSRADFISIISRRLNSYLFTLFPAAIFSVGLTYLGTVTIGASIGPANAILGLGLASFIVFLIILFVSTRPRETLK